VSAIETIPARASTPDDLYEDAAQTYGSAWERLARAYEADADLRRDLVQEIHIAFMAQLQDLRRTLLNSHLDLSRRPQRRRIARGAPEPHAHAIPYRSGRTRKSSRHKHRSRPHAHARPPAAADSTTQAARSSRDPVLLEGLDAAAIGEITGLSATNVATKIHRIKTLLARWFQQEENSMNESPNNSVLEIWQNQPVEVTKMSLTEIRRRADKLEHPSGGEMPASTLRHWVPPLC
jgi:RNA polymerase sigma-70 factor, ECF subfamily